ncbi:MAG: hypothetical protein NTY80_04795 [candidate division SR1 bacterium]|nr:hypothetical protein [candidate division SR1 bacterium]
MTTYLGNAEMHHETIALNSKQLRKIVSETKLEFLDALEILETPEIEKIRSLFIEHQSELLEYSDQTLFDISQSKNTGHGLYLFKQAFKNSTILSKYSTKITLGNIIKIFKN